MPEIIAYPIIFSGPMVRALLDGRKSQTRRLAWQCLQNLDGEDRWYPSIWQKRLNKFHAGERPWLWVKETGCFVTAKSLIDGGKRTMVQYRASVPDDTPPFSGKWTPSIHMPKWASRISLRVTGMRIERLQDISEEDARAEGVNAGDYNDNEWLRTHPYAAEFWNLWDSIHGPGAWAENPEVVVTEFEVHQQNIGSVR